MMMVLSDLRRAEYQRVYDTLMKRAADRTYEKGVHERHHIVPISLGGLNVSENIVCLTYREHFLAHWLLTKLKKGAELKKMLHALARISGNNSSMKTRTISSWQYEIARKANHLASIGHKLSKETRAKLSKARIGNQNSKGYRHTPETCATRSIKLRGNKNALGYKHTAETRRQIGRSNYEEKHWRSKPVKCLDDGREFPCASAAARFYGILDVGVGAVCRGEQRTTRNLSFAYMSDLAQEKA